MYIPANDRVPPGCRCYLSTTLCSILGSVMLPSFLIKLRGIHGVLPINQLVFTVTLFCAPGAIILSLILTAILVKNVGEQSLDQVMVDGAICGAVIAVANLPGYCIAYVLGNDTLVFLRIVLMFVVSGTTCGMWTAWEAWRLWHPEESFLPRFSLRTLMLFVLLWGAVLLVFQPRPAH